MTEYMIPDLPGIINLSKDAIDEVSGKISQSYFGYPYFQYLFNGDYNESAVKLIYSIAMKSENKNVIGVVSEDGGAVALYMRPDSKGIGIVKYLLSGGLKLPFVTSYSTLSRLIAFEKYSTELMNKYANEDTWYLMNLSTVPGSRHTGATSSVVRPMLDHLDSIGCPCYLETNKDENVPMYEHFGFEVMEKGNVPNSNVPHYAMLRQPKPR